MVIVHAIVNDIVDQSIVSIAHLEDDVVLGWDRAGSSAVSFVDADPGAARLCRPVSTGIWHPAKVVSPAVSPTQADYSAEEKNPNEANADNIDDPKASLKFCLLPILFPHLAGHEALCGFTDFELIFDLLPGVHPKVEYA